ncbi:MAG TPA: hypothetical protein VLV83_18325 [Acidobacteriota bacterium]|nr:hypothetical protein [Acidobacteriota bacterium]
MARTTLLIDDAVLLEIKGIARSQRRTLKEVVTEALEQYAAGQSSQRLPSFTAAGRSEGKRSIARDAEDILKSDADKAAGW